MNEKTKKILTGGQRLLVLPKACDSCPYRRDVPPGVWAKEEYDKLPLYDCDAPMPALSSFLCHQSHATEIATVCRGWLSVHRDSVAARISQIKGELLPEDIPTADESNVYYESGAEAAKAGKRGVRRPSKAAKQKVRNLVRRGIGRFSE